MPTIDKTIKLIWRANYDDDTSLVEMEQNGKHNKFSEIDQKKLISFELIAPPQDAKDFEKEEVSTVTHNMRGDKVKVTFTTYNNDLMPYYRVNIAQGQRLIFKRRTTKTSGQHSAIFGVDPRQYKDPKDVPTCDKCKTKLGIKNVPYPLQYAGQTIILVGWQETVNGKNTQSVTYLYPDGMIETSGRWGSDAIHQEASFIVDENAVEEKKYNT